MILAINSVLSSALLRDSFDPPQESKASLPALDQAIDQTLMGSHVEMLLWIAENRGDPSHTLAEIAAKLFWQSSWQAFRPGDPPPRAWLPLSIILNPSHHTSPLFIHHHQAPFELNFTENQWQEVQQQYAPFWLVQGASQFAKINLYEANALHQAQGQLRLLLHCETAQVMPLEESTYLMPHNAEGQLLPARYARVITDSNCKLDTWVGRYAGAIGEEASTPAGSHYP